MKKNKKIFVILVPVAIFVFIACFFYFKNKNTLIVNNVETPIDSIVVYSNTDYGFNFSLPDDWKGYSIVTNTWNGNPLTTNTKEETGPTILIRNPKWTSAVHYEDIPIMVFTLAQWDSYVKEDYAVSAAPISATELARNNTYVFALPPRWDFDYSEGFQEAENILRMNPIKVFDLK
ncbi:MAG: hypothetical protein WCI41_02235 [bacterium]